MRKAAIRLGAATNTGIDWYMEMPVREFIEINNEVAAQWQKGRRN